MFNSIIDTSNLSASGVLICMALALGLGALLAAVYYFFGERKSKGFLTTLVLLPVLVQSVMLVMWIVGSMAVGLATFGIFTLVKFRSLPGSAMDIGVLFAEMAVGVLLGMGYVAFASIVAAVIIAVFVGAHFIPVKEFDPVKRKLKVVITEDTDYSHAFDDLFLQYTKTHVLERVKSTDLGSMFELTYQVTLKKSDFEKNLLDEIRTRNGNLPVIFSVVSYEDDKRL